MHKRKGGKKRCVVVGNMRVQLELHSKYDYYKADANRTMMQIARRHG